MGWRETRGAWTLALFLVLLLNLLAEPLSSDKEENVPTGAVVSEPAVELMEAVEGLFSARNGVGMRDVILTSGCPEGEKKCIVRIEECRGPPDCGWGKPFSETLESVKMPCISVPPENRFQYVWKMLIPDQQSLIIPNDSAILEVHRDTHPVAFECDTMENDELVASVKYTVYTTEELETRRHRKGSTDVVLVFVLVIGIIIAVGTIFAVIFIILNWAAVKVFWQTKVWKSREDSTSSVLRTSSGMTPTIDVSQVSQQEGSSHRQMSYHEWNEPPPAGVTEEEKGNY